MLSSRYKEEILALFNFEPWIAKFRNNRSTTSTTPTKAFIIGLNKTYPAYLKSNKNEI